MPKTPSILEQIKANVNAQYNTPKPTGLPQVANVRNVPDWGTGSITLSTSVQQIVGPNQYRTSFRITNQSSLPIYISNSAAVNLSGIGCDVIAPGFGQYIRISARGGCFGFVLSGTAVVSWSETFL